MNENFISGQYNVEKKSKIKKFYDDNKIYIYSALCVFLIAISTISIYSYIQNKKKNSLSNNYISANIHIKNGNKTEALNVLKKTIYSNDSTYSSLSLFLIVYENLETNKEEVIKYMSKRILTPEGTLAGYKVKCMPRLMYKLMCISCLLTVT